MRTDHCNHPWSVEHRLQHCLNFLPDPQGLVLHFSINAKIYQPYASVYLSVKLREFGSGVLDRELPVAL